MAMAVTTLLLFFATTLACSTPTESTVGGLAEAKATLASCPTGVRLASRGAIDVSGPMRHVAGDPGRLDPIRNLVNLTVICGGHLRIEAFGGSSAQTTALYDGDVDLPGATENARLRRAPGMVDEVMAAVTKNLSTAAARLPENGTDIVAQLGLSAEYKQQLDPEGSKYQLRVVITTDGRQTEQVALTDPALTEASARALAQQVQAPNLSGADVLLAGIGKSAGPAPLTRIVDALKAFHGQVCKNSGAARCTVVTDGAGR
ncbi:hypothetical protein [Nocardia brasiliensis]|uniref:hypothetical protein n=1 Tax=Nocardia brasiliensis TaxID=37326 RepID=UPI003D933E2D